MKTFSFCAATPYQHNVAHFYFDAILFHFLAQKMEEFTNKQVAKNRSPNRVND
jgi:hypothetical protein